MPTLLKAKMVGDIGSIGGIISPMPASNSRGQRICGPSSIYALNDHTYSALAQNFSRDSRDMVSAKHVMPHAWVRDSSETRQLAGSCLV
jgi:hypothetical protein